jgi:hypothetical protein
LFQKTLLLESPQDAVRIIEINRIVIYCVKRLNYIKSRRASSYSWNAVAKEKEELMNEGNLNFRERLFPWLKVESQLTGIFSKNLFQ